MEFFAAAVPGTEQALRDELCELGFQQVRLNRGGIPFAGEWNEGRRACLYSRIAQRVQALVGRFNVQSPEDLYDGVYEIDWTPYITPKLTLAVSAFCRSEILTHSGATALKAKDAIVDQIREHFGERPDINREDPDVRIFIQISGAKAKVYLDMSGDALHRRGYRRQTGEAPLRETLAAAILRMSGWDRESPLADPMCGSGTIAIEAALWAGKVAPGLMRDAFGFERWAMHNDEEKKSMAAMRGEARRIAHRQIPKIIASDMDPEVLDCAKQNAKAAGVRMKFKQRDVKDFPSDGEFLVVCNPPYDVRLQADQQVLSKLASAFTKMHGRRVCLLSGNPLLEKTIPVAPVDAFPVMNGNIDCDFLRYKMP